VDWKRALRGAWSARRNWRRGRPTHREAFPCHTRASGLCFDHRFLYVGLNRGCVQVCVSSCVRWGRVRVRWCVSC
jgi:hypothetical protein